MKMTKDNEEFDPFHTTTGLADDLTVTLRNVRFGTDPGYTREVDGDTVMPALCICDFAGDDPDIGANGVLENQFITIGTGWEVIDGGKAVQREDGRKKGFNNSTYMGALISTCIEVNEPVMRDRFETTKLTPMEAAYWEGLTLHMVQTDYEAFNKKRSRLLPDEVKGWVAAKPAGGAKKASKKAVAKKAAPKVEEDAPAPGAELEAIREQIIAIAKSSEDDGGVTFVERCYSEIEGLDDSATAMALVDDLESEESIWQVHGATEVE